MFNISEYLQKFKKLGEDKQRIKQVIADSLKKETGVDIDPATIRVSSGEISVSAPPATHAVIFMRKSNVLATLKERLPNISIDRIRCR